MRKKISCQTENLITFKEGVEEYLIDCKRRNLRKDTLRHYRESYKSITRIIDENIYIKDLNINSVGEFVVKCKEKFNINDQTLHTYTRDLKTCRFGEYRNWVLVNFILSTGLRLNSFVNIKVKDIDFDNEVVFVNMTKNRKPLIIPLNNIIIKILKEYLRIRKPDKEDDYLFCNDYGIQLSKCTINASLSSYNKKRGINKTGIHRYRHTFAKKWIMNGGNVVTLQKILGHSNLQITENYINLLVQDLKIEMDKYNPLEQFTSSYINLR